MAQGLRAPASGRNLQLFRFGSFALALVLIVGAILGSQALLNSISSHKTSNQSSVAGAATTATPVPDVVVATPVRQKKVVVAHPKHLRQKAPPKLTVRRSGSRKTEIVALSPQTGTGPYPAEQPAFGPSGSASVQSFNISPSPTATPRTFATLKNYWLSASRVHPAETISFDYVIENPTTVVDHVWLGASIKPTQVRSWADSISDPARDVVATVNPGTTLHLRYFSLASGLRPGVYDVAWGLRDSVTEDRVALVVAKKALTVTQ